MSSSNIIIPKIVSTDAILEYTGILQKVHIWKYLQRKGIIVLIGPMVNLLLIQQLLLKQNPITIINL
jgi:hypothetical protein